MMASQCIDPSYYNTLVSLKDYDDDFEDEEEVEAPHKVFTNINPFTPADCLIQSKTMNRRVYCITQC